MSATKYLVAASLAALLLIPGCTRRDEPAGDKAPFAVAEQQQTTRSEVTEDGTQSRRDVQLRTFNRLITALREHYVYGDHHAVPWDDLESRYRTRVLGLIREGEFADVMRELINELPPDAALWQSRDERIDLQSSDARHYEGIGAYVAFRASPTPRVILLSVMAGSPAERAGLRDHDSLLAVDGIPIRREEGDQVVTRIRGPAGSVVNLTVRSPNEAPRVVAVTRGQVQLGQVTSGLRFALLPESDIAYLLFPRQTSATLTTDVVQLLRGLAEQVAVRGLILDLRIAAVGESWPLVEMLTLFSDGALGELYSTQETFPISVTGQDVAGSQTLPLAVLIGSDTEGYPEVFAAALQSVGRAVLFGTRTSGEIETRQLVPLPDGSRLFIASTAYRTPTQLDVGLNGLEPNLRVGFDWDAVTAAVDPVRDASQAALMRTSG